MSRSPRIAVVGTGPVGRALAAAYVMGGGETSTVVSRDVDRAREIARRVGAARGSADLRDAFDADVVIVAVADRALTEVAARVAAAAPDASRTLLHTSGALASDAFARADVRAGSLHPLQSFPTVADDAAAAARVAGTHWFHEGGGFDEAAKIVAVWRGTLHRIAPGKKALYHAAAAALSNHAVALFDSAVALFEAAGVPRDQAQTPLAALLVGTAANLASVGSPAALTGPIARGDVEVVRRHLDALRDAAPDLVESYVAMARRTLVVARAKGSLSATHAAALDELLSRPLSVRAPSAP